MDPDSNRHGVAIYINGVLNRCCSWQLNNFIGFMQQNKHEKILFCIEDVCANNAAFKKSGVKNAKAATAINRSIGKCQQAQVELERIIIAFSDNEIRHFKISKMWKSQLGKKQFEKVTGWTGRSNEDTRSSAWFGYLGVTESKKGD